MESSAAVSSARAPPGTEATSAVPSASAGYVKAARRGTRALSRRASREDDDWGGS